ncbi:UDP-N-acetylmuramoyl-L-alanine--D-glutamate ligase [Cecembia sp.]|uniref:UDP-N-acetylmuramoyl-L-alanine--D-glutamate ligase n=1 Tax=Cecembia sp. TaxID=1898110 RepID=UPI0025BC9941|nr:UDP-N-acetylmuramoyl-L-alanine--D-glutamate ligase [Cecembia sp.]
MKRKISILGAGESGIGAALLAVKLGYAVWVSEAGSINPARKAKLESAAIPFEEGGHDMGRILDAEELIKSPGIPPKAEVVKAAMDKGIPVIDELEFAYRFSKGKVIAVTGTNGKTTTAMLTYHLLKKGGLDVGLAGNVGRSWAAQLADKDHDWWVLETSSFQIDGFINFKPTIAMLTNITPDHLDRYDYQLDNYISSKMSLFKKMDANQAVILNADDILSKKGLQAKPVAAAKYLVSLHTKQIHGGYFDGQNLAINAHDKNMRISKDEIILKGKHNMLNSMMAGIGAILAGVGEKAIREGLQDFKNAAHRMEPVTSINGVVFINDSKGTNVDATAFALDSFQQAVIWIAGGVDKGNDYSALDALVKDKVKMLICLGLDNEKLKKAFQGKIDQIKETKDIVQAVTWAQEFAQEGDLVLLSPACASFDLFRNYEERGEQFKEAVYQLKLQKA